MGNRGKATLAVAVLSLVWIAANVDAAAAVTRYAAPGGISNQDLCQSANPFTLRCSIYAAAVAGGGTGGTPVTTGDSVVIEPGNYSDSDLGPSGTVSPTANTVGGAAGQPRPVITLNNAGSSAAFDLQTSDFLSHVEIDTSARSQNLHVSSSGTAEDVIARTTAASATACAVASGTLRESACLATGSGDSAVGTAGAGGTLSITLRDVTAVASGNASRGLNMDNGGTSGAATASVKSVIARASGTGTPYDVVATTGGGTASMTVNIDYSNYATAGGATIVPGGNNQSGAPALAADGYHELSSSSATIDLGQTDGSSGTADIDGQTRTISGFPDIGADELGKPTTTTVSCSPPSIELGASSNCTGGVSDTSASPLNPTGTVHFSSDMAGSFSGGGDCSVIIILHVCMLSYTPSVAGTHTITAAYRGDANHEPSSGTTTLPVTEPPPPPPPDSGSPTGATASTPATTTPRRCKKGRKLKHGRCVKKKRH